MVPGKAALDESDEEQVSGPCKRQNPSQASGGLHDQPRLPTALLHQ